MDVKKSSLTTFNKRKLNGTKTFLEPKVFSFKYLAFMIPGEMIAGKK